jgi:hypothetical protein
LPDKQGVTCACGQPLHYTNPHVQRTVEKFVAELGETVTIRTPYGSWPVPRHYIALHGITAADLPTLAERYGWREIPGSNPGSNRGVTA